MVRKCEKCDKEIGFLPFSQNYNYGKWFCSFKCTKKYKLEKEQKKKKEKNMIKEYKRKCKECGKVWHALASREKEIERDIRNNAFSQCAFCGMPGAQLQAKRNVESQQALLSNLKKCPECSSINYEEKTILHKKR